MSPKSRSLPAAAARQVPDPPASNSPFPALVTPSELASCLRTSTKAIYTMVERGQVPGVVRIGRRLLFRQPDLVAWLSEKSGAPSPDGDRR